MPAIRQDALLLRILKDLNDVRSALRRVVVNLPLFDIANENTPAQLTSDQNNYVPGNYDLLKLSSDQAGRTITGFRGGIKGRFLRLFNIGDYEIVISSQSVSSDAENRIISPTGFDIIMNAGGELLLYYDSTQQRWISTYNSNSQRIQVELQISGLLTINGGAYEQIIWDVVVQDTSDFFDALNPTYITIPETGWYQTTLHVAWTTNGTGLRETLLERSDSSPHGNISFDSRTAVTGAGTNIELARLEYFDKGEKVYATVWHNAAATLDIAVNGPRGSATTLIVTKM